MKDEFTVEVDFQHTLLFRQTPNIDNSGLDYETLLYDTIADKWYRLGTFDTTLGVMMFDSNTVNDVGCTDLDYKVLRKLADTIELKLEN